MAMSVELDASFEPLSGEYLENCCKPAYRVKWLKNKGAILVIIWNYLAMTVYYLIREGYNQKQLDNPFRVNVVGLIMWCMALLFPIGGWLADTRVGRYKMIHYSTWIMWIGIVLATLGELLLTNVVADCPEHIKTGVYSCLCTVAAIGLSGFLSNIIHLGIDQLIDASAIEITSFISWYTLTLYASGITLHYITDCVVNVNIFYIKTLVVAVCLTLALCLDFLFQHILVNEQVAGKSLRVIMKVIRYTIKNRHLRHNLTVTTNNITPSRFDVAKHIHGGPFTSQQVDNVRTFLWMLIIIATCTMVFGAMQPLEYAQEKVEHHLRIWKKADGIKACYKNLALRYDDHFIVIVLIFLYEFIIHPLFYRCLPKVRITSKFMLATVVFLLWILSLLALDIGIYLKQKTIDSNQTSTSGSLPKCIFVDKPDIIISHTLQLIPSFLDGLSHFLLASSALEYIWAQTPSTMKGLMLGFGYMFLGLSTLIHTAVSFPFFYINLAKRIPWLHTRLTCEIWYFLLEAVIILAALIMTGILVKKHNQQKQRNTY